MILLTTDWHLDDNPDNEYRWAIAEHVLHAVIQHRIDTVFILGDLVDRKDRHSGAFVNRLIDALRQITARAPTVILRGNHDTPLRGPAYWEFLSQLDNLRYVTKPEPYYLFDNDDQPDLLLLPFTANPLQDWRELHLSRFKAMFMHATVTGAIVENGTVMENNHFPILPRQAKIYSGDVHTPQQVRNVTYVGAPHPIKFGDRYPCRLLLLNEDYGVALEQQLPGLHKLLVDIHNARELADLKVAHGDQVKIRFSCAPAQLTNWGEVEMSISKWAADHGVVVAGVEVLIDSTQPMKGADIDKTPEQIMRQFAASERIPEELLAIGLQLLSEL